MFDEIINRLGGMELVASDRPSSDDLTSLANRLNRNLDTDFSEFLMHWGGMGWCKEVCYPLPSGEYAPVAYFYGGGPTDDPLTLESALESYAHRLPAGWISFAEEGAGNQICIRIDEPGKGSIGLWDHEQEECPDSTSETAILVVASSFREWMNNLRAT